MQNWDESIVTVIPFLSECEATCKRCFKRASNAALWTGCSSPIFDFNSEKLFSVYLTIRATHVHEKCESIRMAYLSAVCSVHILSKRARTEVLEDGRGSTRNELKESTRWKQLLG